MRRQIALQNVHYTSSMIIDDLVYTFRRSKRAKRLSLRIDADKGLEIVLPRGTTESHGLHFLKQNYEWVRRHYQPPNYQLIKELDLQCINHRVDIRYLPSAAKQVRLSNPLPEVLILSGPIKDARCCQPQLNRWLKRQATLHLLPMLTELSNETGLIYRQAAIRLQRGRWGSCSAEGDISLNARLLLKPYEFVRYVLIHELCHLKELNHSPRFWKLVASFVPDYQRIKQLADS